MAGPVGDAGCVRKGSMEQGHVKGRLAGERGAPFLFRGPPTGADDGEDRAALERGLALLHRYPLFHSSSLDETRERVSRVFKPHRLRLVRPGQTIDGRMNRMPIGRHVSVNRLGHGAAVEIDPGALETFYLIQMPLCGAARIRLGREEFRSDERCGALLSPTRHLWMQWEEGCEQMMVQITRTGIERHLARMLGRPLWQPLEFAPRLDLTSPQGRRWRSFIAFVITSLAETPLFRDNAILCEEFERLVMTYLLTSHDHNYRQALDHRDDAAVPYYVRRAERYMLEHAKDRVCVQDLAAAAGVSVRTLFDGFRRFRGCSPMRYFKTIRLQAVHDELKAAEPGSKTVTEVATRWGFFELGRFSVDYRKRFGESPSQTLRRPIAS